MAKRKSSDDQPTANIANQEAELPPPQAQAAEPGPPAQASPATDTAAYQPVQAPPMGPSPAYTIDNYLGYRKEDVETPKGKRRQIRFADRADGNPPDDEVLEPVRTKKPRLPWEQRAWQARKNEAGFEAIDLADQELNEIGRKRRQGPGR
jgi:hypothetical protein